MRASASVVVTVRGFSITTVRVMGQWVNDDMGRKEEAHHACWLSVPVLRTLRGSRGRCR